MQRTRELLEPTAAKKLYADVRSDIDDRWDADWKKLCVGRDVFEQFHKDHVSGLGYEVFRNKTARKIRELERVPEPITNVMDTLTAGLS